MKQLHSPRSAQRSRPSSLAWPTAMAVLVLVVGFALLGIGHTSYPVSASPPHRLLPVFGESDWGRWHKEDIGIRFPASRTTVFIGQNILVPHDIAIRVDSVDRNWSPPSTWQAPPGPVGGQDDATGKEIILVRFTITNESALPLMYSDLYFSLVRANGREQRVAALDELPGDQYGSFGSTPWLLPGVTKHSFVPFLVNPGEQPKEFVFYRYTVEYPAQVSKTPTGKPRWIGIARIEVALQTTRSSVANSKRPVTFVPTGTFTVTTGVVYSPSPK